MRFWLLGHVNFDKIIELFGQSGFPLRMKIHHILTEQSLANEEGVTWKTDEKMMVVVEKYEFESLDLIKYIFQKFKLSQNSSQENFFAPKPRYLAGGNRFSKHKEHEMKIRCFKDLK